MRLKSIYGFLKWQLTKMSNRIQAAFDSLTWKPQEEIDVEEYLVKFGNKRPFFFIQIGANDGITADKLHIYIKKYKWDGILVEPVPEIFERLKMNYKHYPNLIFENCAIGKMSGFLTFYSISESNSEGVKHREHISGLDQLGSFDKQTLLKHVGMFPRFETFIKEILVPTITLNEMYTKYQINSLQLLQIDTEGHDFEILFNESFSVVPDVLIFEHLHMTRFQYKVLLKKLKRLNYKFFVDGRDTVAIQN